LDRNRKSDITGETPLRVWIPCTSVEWKFSLLSFCLFFAPETRSLKKLWDRVEW
jgi:hypothetical protein